MAIYTTILAGSNLSTLVASLQTQHDAIMTFQRGTVTPTVVSTGIVWNRTDYAVLGDAWVRYNGSAYTLLLDPEFAQLNAGGTVAMGADLAAGGFKLTGLAAGTANGHSVRYEQVLLRSGALAMTGALDMGTTNKIVNLAAPTAATDAVRLVDLQASGLVYFQTNRDDKANGFPVKLQIASDLTTTYTVCPGFAKPPRQVTVKLKGRLQVDTGGSTIATLDSEITFNRWIADSTGGFTGGVFETKQIHDNGAGTTYSLQCEWKATAPVGVFLRIRASSGSSYYKIFHPSTSVDGVVQMLAIGEGS